MAAGREVLSCPVQSMMPLAGLNSPRGHERSREGVVQRQAGLPQEGLAAPVTQRNPAICSKDDQPPRLATRASQVPTPAVPWAGSHKRLQTPSNLQRISRGWIPSPHRVTLGP